MGSQKILKDKLINKNFVLPHAFHGSIDDYDFTSLYDTCFNVLKEIEKYNIYLKEKTPPIHPFGDGDSFYGYPSLLITVGSLYRKGEKIGDMHVVGSIDGKDNKVVITNNQGRPLPEVQEGKNISKITDNIQLFFGEEG